MRWLNNATCRIKRRISIPEHESSEESEESSEDSTSDDSGTMDIDNPKLF